MSHWIGSGLKFLQRIWGLVERPAGDDEDAVCLTLSLKLHGSLAELGWGGWKMVALPLVLKATVRPSLLDQEPRKLFSFLASLKRLKKLNPGEVDMVWKAKIEKCALARLEVLKGQAGDAVVSLSRHACPCAHRQFQDSEINDIISLSPFFSDAVVPVLLGLVDYNLQPDTDPAMDERRAWIVDAAVQALSRRDTREWTAKVPLQQWALLAVEKWASSRHVLGSLVVLSEAMYVIDPPHEFRAGYAYTLFSVPQRLQRYPSKPHTQISSLRCCPIQETCVSMPFGSLTQSLWPSQRVRKKW
jgi:U3 small nucleolar RNA-associated protein 20